MNEKNLTINGESERTDPGGRPSTYRPEYATQARKLCKLGAIDEELADFFDVTIRTIHRWKSKHKDFGKAVRVGKSRADERVRMALYRRAVGFFTKETKVMHYQGVPVYAEVDVEVLPDVRAATIWMVNRQGWRMSHQAGEEATDTPEPTQVTVEVVNARLRPPEGGENG
jgi:hypothetical protein